jgi:hypothetical protein
MRLHDRLGYTIIDMPSVISHAAVDQVALKLWGRIGRFNHKYVVNMEHLDTLQAAHVRILAHIYQLVSNVYSQIFIANAGDTVRTALQFAKIDRDIPVYESLMEFELEKNLQSAPRQAGAII